MLPINEGRRHSSGPLIPSVLDGFLELHHDGKGELLFVAAKIGLPQRCVSGDAGTDCLGGSDVGGVLLFVWESRHGGISGS